MRTKFLLSLLIGFLLIIPTSAILGLSCLAHGLVAALAGRKLGRIKGRLAACEVCHACASSGPAAACANNPNCEVNEAQCRCKPAVVESRSGHRY